jgi:hypothetical protein
MIMSERVLFGSVTALENSSINVVRNGLMFAIVPCAISAAPLRTDTMSPTTNGRVTKIEIPEMRLSSRFCEAKPTTMPETEPRVRMGDGSTPTKRRQRSTETPTRSHVASEFAGRRARLRSATSLLCRCCHLDRHLDRHLCLEIMIICNWLS